MGLLQNGYRDNIGLCTFYGAGVSNGSYPYSLPINYHLTGRNKNLTAGEGITDDKVGVPLGNRHPGVWIHPQKAGMLSSRNAILRITTNADGVRGLPGEGTSSFSISFLDADGELIVSGSGTASFELTADDASLTASLNGIGSSSFSIFTNEPILGAEAGLTGTANLTFTASALRYAIGHMEGTTDVQTELTVNAIVSGVWSDEAGEIIKKMLYNKVIRTDDVVEVYEDDGVNVWKSFNLENGGRIEL